MITDPDCLFCHIVAGEVPATVVRNTETTLAFHDIDPKAPSHVVVVSKEHYTDAGALARADPGLAGELLRTAAEVALEEGVAEAGYRLVLNVGVAGGQTVFHVHCHMLGGRALSWPPG